MGVLERCRRALPFWCLDALVLVAGRERLPTIYREKKRFRLRNPLFLMHVFLFFVLSSRMCVTFLQDLPP